MGSLMPGWSTKPGGADDALKRSSSSLTKAEVEKFWQKKRSYFEEHLDEAHKHAAASPKSGALPTIVSSDATDNDAKVAAEDPAEDDEAAKMSTSLPANMARPAWWTRSRWAFLNDPPNAEEKRSKYTPQFDVATKGHMAADHYTRSSSGL